MKIAIPASVLGGLLACQPAPVATPGPGQQLSTITDDNSDEHQDTGSGAYDNAALNNSELSACISACMAAGQTESQCMALPWDEGGCGSVIDNGPEGDPILIPRNYEKIEGSVEFCMHNREDYLVVQDGSMSFSAQRGWMLADVKSGGGFFSSFSLGNLISQFIPLFASTGNASKVIPGCSSLKNRAKVVLDGAEKEWPYPGAISFSVIPSIADRADLSVPVIFVKTGVEEGGDSLHRAFKSVDKQVHLQNYYGADRNLDIVKFRKEPMIGFIGDRFPTDGRFKLKFEIHYKPL